MKFNAQQQQAIERIWGPLLVLAGPGTGKTELLSARVHRILQDTDTPPGNILCLTFTNSGQTNMRERLTRYIGPDAYKVHIHTYHSFGSQLIAENSDYFPERDFDTAIDDVASHQLIATIQTQLSHKYPLRKTRDIPDIQATIKEIKENLLTAADLTEIVSSNQRLAKQINPILAKLPSATPRKQAEITALADTYADIFTRLSKLDTSPLIIDRSHTQIFTNLHLLVEALATAIRATHDHPKPTTKFFTAWRNQFLVKNATDQFVVETFPTLKLAALAIILQHYEQYLEANNLYDYTDMVLEAIRVIEQNRDLKYTLQERYQFILLDEYQDTNPAQQHLIELLTDNPVHEGRPNIMAVGDDDQAIYSFQGADVQIFQNFSTRYHLTTDDIVCLTDNYRSSPKILDLAGQIRAQLAYRFADTEPQLNKTLTPHHDQPTTVEYLQFDNYMQENDYVARQIATAQAAHPEQTFAIIAPRHKYLESIVPYFRKHQIPVTYDKRENVLESPLVTQILQIARLCIAIHDDAPTDHFWPEILTYEYWGIDPAKIWQLARTAASEHQPWLNLIMDYPADYPDIYPVARLAHAIACHVDSAPLETAVDYIIGSQLVPKLDLPSPIRDFYIHHPSDTTIYETLAILHTLRNHIRAYTGKTDQRLYLRDLLKLADDYTAAGQKIISTINFHEAASRVTLLSAHQSKGLEFDHVYLISSNDHAWSNAKGNNNRLTLPRNLEKIRHTSATDDEKLRLLFVAITRAKSHLTITTSEQDLEDRSREPLRYYANLLATTTPSGIADPTIDDLTRSWHYTHVQAASQLPELFADQLSTYTMSPTHLNNFVDLSYGGPHRFFVNNFLRFSEAPSSSTIYGSAIHAALEQAQRNPADPESAIAIFIKKLDRRQLADTEADQLTTRGTDALAKYLDERAAIFRLPHVEVEVNLRSEHVVIGDARLTGKIDRLEINAADKTITVVDYKTGSGNHRLDPARVQKDRNAEMQLYFYKLLLEHSTKYRGYRVTTGRIEFVEPDLETGLVYHPEITFDDAKYTRFQQLVQAVWHKIMAFDFPDTDASYTEPSAIKNSIAFENDLLK
jgi:DNA helicase-2/ATP-dependent DNA helicase PcrA